MSFPMVGGDAEMDPSIIRKLAAQWLEPNHPAFRIAFLTMPLLPGQAPAGELADATEAFLAEPTEVSNRDRPEGRT
jgi:hypothetical protein